MITPGGGSKRPGSGLAEALRERAALVILPAVEESSKKKADPF